MRRTAFAILLLLATGGSTRAVADPLFTVTLTGDGHTFQFTTPNPPTVADHPHVVQVAVDGLPGTVDGVGGYTFDTSTIVELNTGQFPTFVLGVNPLPVGTVPQPPHGPDYDLFGPTITTLVSDVPNPNPQCYQFVCNDLLTFAFVPSDYNFSGTDPNGTFGLYTLTITPSPATGATPEPAGFLLTATGAFGIAAMRLRRRPGGVAPLRPAL
jgi:hypothetical protein